MDEKYILTEDIEISSIEEENQAQKKREEITVESQPMDLFSSDEEFNPDMVLELIDIAAERALKGSHHNQEFIEQKDQDEHFGLEEASQIINRASDEILSGNQIDELSNRIFQRFEKIKEMDEDNYNAFELAMLCQKLAKDYKQLAHLKKWTEIEALFS
ncbi:MAG: hypothetical protein H7A25_13390 [Leptospiraceae bacterium]|nr:hypothetical protein [Leptospiraceae bacterium]MCP5500895.1 hypothetical protein [Leptospiraceae bacterium]